MDNKDKRFSLGKKIYLFVGVTVFLAAITVAVISYLINANRIDDYFKELSLNNARNFATMVDPYYLEELKAAAESEEFQALRDRAEAEDNEALIEEYLKENGLWDGYVKTRDMLSNYRSNMKNVKYLYIVSCGGVDENYDMYLVDDYDVEMYETGYYEERETELLGLDASKEVQPTISYGDWGWLCSSFVPVCKEDGTLVCQVGCDVGMDDIIKERRMNFLYIILAAIGITGVILAGVMLIINKTIISPLNLITKEMKKFSPSDDHDFERSGVIDLEIKSNDEIEDIYNEIRSMQVRILDYLDDIIVIQKEKEKAESDVKKKVKEIGQISKEAYRDALTSVGSMVAYVKKTEEMNIAMGQSGTEFAIVMVDVNFLKVINDKYGHAAGDEYLKGCCNTVCQIYKHSPVYRIGGDEFVVIVMGEDYKKRQDRLDKMRATFEASYMQTDLDPWVRYSAASGMAVYNKDDASVDAVFKRADKEMYEEKVRFKRANGIDPTSR